MKCKFILTWAIWTFYTFYMHLQFNAKNVYVKPMRNSQFSPLSSLHSLFHIRNVSTSNGKKIQT